MNQRCDRLITLCGIAAVNSLAAGWIARATSMMQNVVDPTIPWISNFYNYTFARFEPLALYALAIFFAMLAWLLWRQKTPSAETIPLFQWRLVAPLLALMVFAVTVAGRFTVHMNFDLSIDEYLNDFEAQILDQHHLVAQVPPEWRDDTYSMKVAYQNYNAREGYWASGLLPGFASLNWLFTNVGLDWALNPLLAAGSIFLLASLSRRAFPDQALPAVNIAILLLAFSPQFLAMALTKFSWTAHLAGTLLWVWLFTHPRRAFFLLTPLLGVLLIGLHQPHVHVLVASSFILRLAREARWKDFGWFVFCYGIGGCVWYPVFAMLRPAALATGGDLHNFLLGHGSFVITAILGLLFALFHAITWMAWTCPVMIPFLTLFVLSWKTQPTLVRDGCCAAMVTFCFYLSFPHPQGHGWGFRYEHSVYGLLALAATGGALTLIRDGFGAQVSRALLASIAFSLFFQIPYRAYEIRTMVRPLALTAQFLATRPTDFVLIKTGDFWYSWDLIRNDPWLRQKPFLFYDERLSDAQRDEIFRRGTVTVVGAPDVKRFGVILSDPAKAPAQ